MGLTIILLIAVSFLPDDISLFGIEIKPVDILSDIRADEDEEYNDDYDYDEEDEDYYEDESNANHQSRNQLAAGLNFPLLPVKSINGFLENSIPASSASINSVQIKKEKISGNVNQLSPFFDALKKADKIKLRIAHYGDSNIEGDLVTANIRDKLQKQFGGGGVGFLAITSQDIAFRITIHHTFSDDWRTATVYTQNRENLAAGIKGEAFVNGKGSWVEYQSRGEYETMRNFDLIRLFYSDAKETNVTFLIDGKTKQTGRLSNAKGLSEIVIRTNNARSVKIEFPVKEQANFYGVSLETEDGIYVDNFPLRGSTGAELIKIDSEQLKSFDDLLNYKLFIFEFGLNALNARYGNFNRYKREMIKVIEHYKSVFPKAGFLIIGAHDKSAKSGTKFMTDPIVYKLLEAQMEIASETGIAFWNLFQAMGGKDSMINWVESNPPLAHKDFIHFNDLGSKKEAEMFSEALLDEYRNYK
ncbi:MAG: hypothetical protein ABIJ40_16115 [Bacteroidota bacterium]